MMGDLEVTSDSKATATNHQLTVRTWYFIIKKVGISSAGRWESG